MKQNRFWLFAAIILLISVGVALAGIGAGNITVNDVNVCLADGSVNFTGDVDFGDRNLTNIDWINSQTQGTDFGGNIKLHNDLPGEGNRVSIIFYNGTSDQRIAQFPSCHTNKSSQNFSECTIYYHDASGVANHAMDLRYLLEDDPIWNVQIPMFFNNKNLSGIDRIGHDIHVSSQKNNSDGGGYLDFDLTAVRVIDMNLTMGNNNIYDVIEIGDDSAGARLKFFSSSVQMTGGNFNVNANNLTAVGLFNFEDDTEVTIASGAITATQSYHKVDTESDASTDNLDTINGGSTGDIIILRTVTGSRDVTVKDGTGNLQIAGDFTLDVGADRITLMYDGSQWVELARSNNA